MPTERSATERHRSGLARWLGHRFVLRAADRCLGRVRLCPRQRGPRGLQCGARIEPCPGSQNRLASFVLTIVFPRGVTRGCASHSAWWPSGMGSIYVHPLGRARHRTRSSPDRRSGCVRCIGADASDPFEVVPLAQSAQLRVLRTAVGNAGAAVVRGVEETCRRHRPSSAHPRPSPMSSGGTTVLSEGT